MLTTTGRESGTDAERDFRARAARGLHRALPPGEPAAGDFDLNPGFASELSALSPALRTPTPAAVLVPVVRRDPLSVLLTLRTADLKSHAGQISFPGGKIDPGDADAVAAALREAREEIALDARCIEPLGFLDAYRTGTGYTVFPVVALISADYRAVPNPAEVSDVFEVPLSFLMDNRNHQRHARLLHGRERHFYAMPYGDRYIWGATAGMIRNMQQRLYQV